MNPVSTPLRQLATHPRLPALLCGFAAVLLLLGHGLAMVSGGSFLDFATPWDIPAVLVLVAGLALVARKRAQSPPTPPRPREWSLDVMRRMDWKRFEELCATYYPTTGIQGRALHLGETGGIDVRLYQDKDAPENTTAIVRCKSSNSRRVDARSVLELAQAMSRQGIAKGFYMCRAGFDEQAMAEAAKLDITVVDGQVLLHLIQRLSPEAQARLLDFAIEGDWATPTCPVCNVKMAVRHKETKQYWRCPNAKTCDQRMKLVV